MFLHSFRHLYKQHDGVTTSYVKVKGFTLKHLYDIACKVSLKKPKGMALRNCN